MNELIAQLMEENYLRTPAIIKAFKKIKRQDFLTTDQKDFAGANEPLMIGFGQTISQPLTVAFMLELLEPKLGQKILDVGSGSGWTAAMLAEIVGPSGQVFAVELIPELKTRGETNCAKYNFSNLKFIAGDGSKGLPDTAPFDRIHVAAAAKEVPYALLKQLKVGGRLVIPTKKQDIKLIVKLDNDKFDERSYPGFVFVPLIEN